MATALSLLSDSLRLVSSLVRAFLEAIVGFVAPPTCAACPERVPPRRPFCPACASALEPLPPGAESLRVPFAYGGPLRTALRAYKYGGRVDLSRPLGHLLRAFLRKARPAADLVVPVPLHPRRRAERGHDQTALLARHVADELGIPCNASALQRTAHGPAQATLTRRARLEGAALKFRAPRRLDGKRVLLVDDVITTGATAEACRAVLLEAGATSVEVLALARAVRDDDGF